MATALSRSSSFTRTPRGLAFAALLIAGFVTAPLAAEDAPAVGTVSGIVTDSRGRPVSGTTVYFFGNTAPSKAGAAGNGSKGHRSVDFTPMPSELAKGILKGKAVTDASGKYEIKTLPAGSYTYRAGDPTTIGMSSGNVTVEAGKAVTADIKLNAPGK